MAHLNFPFDKNIYTAALIAYESQLKLQALKRVAYSAIVSSQISIIRMFSEAVMWKYSLTPHAC